MKKIKNLFIILFIINNLYFSISEGFDFVNFSQGIIITENQIKKLNINKNNKEFVLNILGNPSIIDPFEPNRWFYIYYESKNNKIINNKKIILTFDDKDILIKIENIKN